MFGSVPDYKKIVILIFLIENDSDFLNECGFLKDDINELGKEFENILIEQNEEYLEYIKNEEEPIIKTFSNK